jgi:hypothetical protein
VNLTYCALIWDLVDARPEDAARMRARTIMRRRSLVTLCVFGTAALIALRLPIPALAICIACLIV